MQEQKQNDQEQKYRLMTVRNENEAAPDVSQEDGPRLLAFSTWTEDALQGLFRLKPPEIGGLMVRCCKYARCHSSSSGNWPRR